MTTRLVSFLGAGKLRVDAPECYDETTYSSNGEKCKPTRVMARVLDELVGPFDEVVFVGTELVERKWIESGVLARELGRDDIQFLRAPLGGHPDDPWLIFDTTLQALGLRDIGHNAQPSTRLSKPDRVTIDVTHAFRAHPMIGLAAVAFAISEWQRMREPLPEVRVFYGAYDAREAAPDGVAPLWELTDILAASRWNTAIDALVRYGRADDLEQLADQVGRTATKEARARGALGPEIGAAAFPHRLGKAARAFADDLALGRFKDVVEKSAKTLRTLLQSEDAVGLARRLPPLHGSLGWLNDAVRPLASAGLSGVEGVRAHVELARLYGNLQRFAEQAAALREGVVSAFALLTGQRLASPGDPGCHASRVAVEREFGEMVQNLKNEKKRESVLSAVSPLLRTLLLLASEVQATRNDLEHLGHNDGPRAARDLRASLSTQTNQFADMLERPTGKFLNLSNHPLSSWPAAQREAATLLELGDPTELEGGLPEVPPEATRQQVEDLAQQVAGRAIRQGAIGAHVAGEPTLCMALVRELQSRGIRCFSATTHRVVALNRDSDEVVQKTSAFRFVAWREFT